MLLILESNLERKRKLTHKKDENENEDESFGNGYSH